MARRRLLVYFTDNEKSAISQIRLIEPLKQCDFDIICAESVSVAELPEFVRDEVTAVVISRTVKKRCPTYDRLVAAARQFRKPVILDVDDLLVRVSRDQPDHAVYQSRALYALKAVVDADLVVASTQPLAQTLALFHDQVEVVPNQLPAPIWQAIGQRTLSQDIDHNGSPLTIGYFGTSSHKPDLTRIEDALIGLLRDRGPQLQLITVGVPLTSRLSCLPNTSEQLLDKSYHRDYGRFAEFVATLPIDVGIAPLIDSPFNRCKSDIKFQEYAALGIPGVYADLSPYRDRVQPEVTGLLAGNVDEWRTQLERLLDTPSLRQRLRHEAAREFLAQFEEDCQRPRKWTSVVERAVTLAKGRDGNTPTNCMAPIIHEMLEYQTGIERRLKRTVEYQVTQAFKQLLRKFNRLSRARMK